MKYIFNAYVDIDGAKYSYTFSDFVLSIHAGDRPGQHIGWEQCNQIINDGWIHIWDLSQNELYLRVERPMYLSPGEYGYAISGYVRLFYLDRKSERNSPVACCQGLFNTVHRIFKKSTQQKPGAKWLPACSYCAYSCSII